MIARSIASLMLAWYVGCVCFNASPEQYQPDDNPADYLASLVSDTNAHLIGNVYVMTGHHFPIDCQSEPWMAAIRLLVGGTDTDC